MAMLLKFTHPLFVGGKVMQTATDEECAVTKLADGWYQVAVHGGGTCDVPPSNIVQRAPSVRNVPPPPPDNPPVPPPQRSQLGKPRR